MKTRMHSSSMRTDRRLTISRCRGVGWGGFLCRPHPQEDRSPFIGQTSFHRADPPRRQTPLRRQTPSQKGDPALRGQTSPVYRQMPVKTLPSPASPRYAVGKNYKRFKAATQNIKTILCPFTGTSLTRLVFLHQTGWINVNHYVSIAISVLHATWLDRHRGSF